jgi:hypothetical protein
VKFLKYSENLKYIFASLLVFLTFLTQLGQTQTSLYQDLFDSGVLDERHEYPVALVLHDKLSVVC